MLKVVLISDWIMRTKRNISKQIQQVFRLKLGSTTMQMCQIQLSWGQIKIDKIKPNILIS